MQLATRDLNLRYQSAFGEIVPDAYESLVLDAIRGDKSLFIRRDELETAWDIFTPALHEIEVSRSKPELYEYGSAGPRSAEKQVGDLLKSSRTPLGMHQDIQNS